MNDIPASTNPDATKSVLLSVTSLIEAIAGFALLVSPSSVVMILLGAQPQSPSELVVARIAGAALLALAVACWRARRDASSRSASGLIAAMLVYNSATVLILTVAGLSSGPLGIALWPAVVLHAAMAVWCITCVRK